MPILCGFIVALSRALYLFIHQHTGLDMEFAKSALPFTRNPLGLMGLFLVVVYALAMLAFTRESIDENALYATPWLAF